MNNIKKYLILGGVLLTISLTLVSYIFFDFEEDMYIAEEVKTTEKEVTEFYVDVKGAVKKPGVYKFISDERVFNAIERAGGISKNADTSNINLSKKLTGEMVVYVYTNAEIKNGTKNINCDTKCNCETLEVDNCFREEESKGKININTATMDDLLKLTGIGESKAKAIINYREENGDFQNIEDLMKVSGIGSTLYENLKEQITI